MVVKFWGLRVHLGLLLLKVFVLVSSYVKSPFIRRTLIFLLKIQVLSEKAFWKCFLEKHFGGASSRNRFYDL